MPGDGNVNGFKGLLIFSTQMDKMGSKYIPFNDFIAESEETLKRKQSSDQLHAEPTEEEKFIKYIPVYSPLKAYKKFIKVRKHLSRTGGYHYIKTM